MYPANDRMADSSAQPVAIWREAERVDRTADASRRLERVQMLALIEIPQHRLTVLQMARICTRDSTSPPRTLPPEAHRLPSGDTVTELR